jgi:hypothetical protein
MNDTSINEAFLGGGDRNQQEGVTEKRVKGVIMIEVYFMHI